MHATPRPSCQRLTALTPGPLAKVALLVCWSALLGAQVLEERTATAWVEVARLETLEQKQWESTHPLEDALALGAGQYITAMYGAQPTVTGVKGTREFIIWWQDHGARELERWASDGFPMLMDAHHMILAELALYSAQCTPRSCSILYVNGYPFAHPERFWAFYDRIKLAGTQVLIKGCSGSRLSREDYDILRYFTPIVYSMWGAPYLPFGLHLTAGDTGNYPVLGMQAPDFTLPRLQTLLQQPGYTDAYSFDYRRPFHSELTAFLLNVCSGYEAIPLAERTPGGPVVRAKPYQAEYPDSVTLSGARGKKPVLIVLSDPIDGYWSTTIPYLEPLYQATKDRMDWYFICDDIGDNIFWSDYYFKPSQRPGQTLQKALTMLEHAQLGKMVEMRYVNLSFPLLVDDLTQRTQNAYTDQGGISKVILIDRQGVIALNNCLYDQPCSYMRQGQFGYRTMTQVHAVVAAGVSSLLDHHGIWDGKPAIIPDWQPSPTLENVKITALDAQAGTMTVAGVDGKLLPVSVDQASRIISTDAMDTPRSLAQLAVGSTVSLSYAPGPAAGEQAVKAKLIVSGASLESYLSNSVYLCTDKLWCPAIATAVSASVITARLSPRTRQELPGLTCWEQAGDRAVPMGTGWMIPIVKSWVEHPDQVLTFQVDRATEVLINGMSASLADIRVGDHLGVEFRSEQSDQHRRPFFIFVYRFAPTDAAAGQAPAEGSR